MSWSVAFVIVAAIVFVAVMFHLFSEVWIEHYEKQRAFMRTQREVEDSANRLVRSLIQKDSPMFKAFTESLRDAGMIK